ncbi:MAG: pyridoxamine 5'-phosphate oxidase family protein, partial [Actinobacteria bacterium]|nr:pyridoxamine 5'-phosphate oxidase family protein [Actinomycetota bacterium]
MNVATIGPTGHPHLVAMWYGFLDSKLAFWTYARS